MRAMLLWTRASDHVNVRLTCRRWRHILDSSAFRWERCQGGFAEIKAVLAQPPPPPPTRSTPLDEAVGMDCDDYDYEDDEWMHYDEIGYNDPEFGYRRNDVHFIVDGRKCGQSSFTILPRVQLRDNFHYIADGLSGDLYATALTFCDAKGRYRLNEVRRALEEEPRTIRQAGLLYVATMYWDEPVVRTSTWAGAVALRSMLMNTALKDQWSVAVYIPEAKSQFSQQDECDEEAQMAYEREMFQAGIMEEDDYDDDDDDDEQNRPSADATALMKTKAEKAEQWREHCKDLTKRDMRHFLRAGFQQATETVRDSACFYVYAVPSMLGHHSPMMSHDEAMSVVICERPQDLAKKNAPSGDAGKLLKMMKRYCSERMPILDKIRESQRLAQAPLEDARFRQTLQAQELEQVRTNMRIMEQECQRGKELLAIELSKLEDEENVDRELARRLADEMKEKFRVFSEEVFPLQYQVIEQCEQSIITALRELAEKAIQESEEKLRELDKRMLAKVTAFVNQAGTNIITSSYVLHFCAFHLDPFYLHLVFNLIPNATAQELALNSFDQHGKTPLMVAACSDNFNRSTIGNRLKMCQLLIQLGADKNIVDASGLTALGWYRKTCRANRDCYAVIGGGLGRTADDDLQDMDCLLLPLKGPTVADDALLEDSDDELVDVSDDDWEDEDD